MPDAPTSAQPSPSQPTTNARTSRSSGATEQTPPPGGSGSAGGTAPSDPARETTPQSISKGFDLDPAAPAKPERVSKSKDG